MSNSSGFVHPGLGLIDVQRNIATTVIANSSCHVSYTDGSRSTRQGTAGAGWYGHWGMWKQDSTRGHLPLPKHEVFDAEATAAAEGLKQS